MSQKQQQGVDIGILEKLYERIAHELMKLPEHKRTGGLSIKPEPEYWTVFIGGDLLCRIRRDSL